MKRFTVDLLREFCRYAAIVIGGTCLFLIVAQVVGYLPYSDRPGPGWYGLFPKITLAGFLGMLSFVAGWALLVLISSPFAFLPIFVIVRLLEWSGVPRFINRTVGGLLGALISSYFILGMGWYIALAGPPVIITGSLGALYGSWILPSRDAITASSSRLSHWRLSAAIGVSIGVVYLLAPDVFHSLLFGRHESYTVDGVITKGGVALVGLRIRNFDHTDSCAGNFTETVTNANGVFSFHLGYKSDDFSEGGPCAYRVTLCYLGCGAGVAALGSDFDVSTILERLLERRMS